MRDCGMEGFRKARQAAGERKVGLGESKERVVR